MTEVDWSEIIKNASLVIASSSIIFGVNAWKREFTGKRKIELAEETLSLFYEAKAAIGWIRSPWVMVGEGSSREPEENEDENEKKIRDSAFVIRERLNKKDELFNKIYSLRFRFMVLFGNENISPFDELHKVLIKMISASDLIASYKIDKYHGQIDLDNGNYKKMYLEAKNVFWQGLTEEEKDPILPTLNSVIENIEKTCKKEIENSF